jgi:hypothetical protein
MDADHFDKLTVAFAGGRRTILRTLLAGMAAPLFGRGATMAAPDPPAIAGDRRSCKDAKIWGPTSGTPEPGDFPHCSGESCSRRRANCICVKGADGDARCVTFNSTNSVPSRRRCTSDRDCPPDQICIDHRGCATTDGGRTVRWQLYCARRCP